MAKPPPRSQYDARPGSWSRASVLLAIVVIAALCGAVAYLFGSH
jgi:hypothetical protein